MKPARQLEALEFFAQNGSKSLETPLKTPFPSHFHAERRPQQAWNVLRKDALAPELQLGGQKLGHKGFHLRVEGHRLKR